MAQGAGGAAAGFMVSAVGAKQERRERTKEKGGKTHMQPDGLAC